MGTNMTSLPWLWNLSGGWSLVLFNKAPAVWWWPCFWRPSAENEPVVWYSSSSVLLWELADSGLGSPTQRSMCLHVCVCPGCIFPDSHQIHIWSVMNHFLLKTTLLRSPALMLINFLLWLFTKTNRKTECTKQMDGAWKEQTQWLKPSRNQDKEKWENAQS